LAVCVGQSVGGVAIFPPYQRRLLCPLHSPPFWRRFPLFCTGMSLSLLPQVDTLQLDIPRSEVPPLLPLLCRRAGLSPPFFLSFSGFPYFTQPLPRRKRPGFFDPPLVAEGHRFFARVSMRCLDCRRVFPRYTLVFRSRCSFFPKYVFFFSFLGGFFHPILFWRPPIRLTCFPPPPC